MRIAFIAAVVALSTPAFAANGDNSQTTNIGADAMQQPSQPAKSSDEAERKICKRIDATESRLAAKKLCLTAEQWKHREEDSSDL